ncbi:MAG: hypothetical protein HY708_02145 [Ignavibacteriae bacterium]|nr:hypothetical protein [Ignavibacteriota bacterium]
MKRILVFLSSFALFIVLQSDAWSQVKWVVGGNMGISIGTGGGATSAGLHIGPMGEVLFGKGPAVGSEFSINTQAGTPIEWANYFKYYFQVSGSSIKPYADAGFGLYFYTGGPYFDIRFGGGAAFPIAKNLYIPAELQLGPVFVTGSTGFIILIRSGIRYDI